jgi:AraC-like DNA-binding protein
MDSLEATRLLTDGSGLAGWAVGTGRFPTRSALTVRISPAEESSPVGRQTDSCSQDSIYEGFSVEELLADVRRAMERNPEATRAAVSQLVTFVSLPPVNEPVTARGGLAPWQKRKVDWYLRQNLDRPVRLNTVAAQVALSVSYFSRAFKETFGTTPHMYVLRLRLELAQKLMLTTEDPLSQIALACGLADQAHLSKLFRRLMGETPNAWRRQNLTDAQAEARRRRSTSGQYASPVSEVCCIAASR